MIRLVVLAAAILALGPVQQNVPASSPVHATLRLAGERTSFKIGEPIRLELVLTADKPGFVADLEGDDDPSDELTISPTDGVHRLEKRCCRDVFTASKLSETPTVLDLALNYWVRIDQPGTYTISVRTRRASESGPNGFSNGKALALDTNAVSFRVEPASLEDEQALIQAAVRNLHSAAQMGLSDGALAAQIRAAEELAFLPGDAAGVEKYKQYRELGALLSVDKNGDLRMASNAYHLLRRGFAMTRNPSVILAAVEADLTNLNEPVTSDMISNAGSLAVTIKHPAFKGSIGSTVPPSMNANDPYVIERARYLDLVHESLERRSGVVKLLSAGAMLDVMVNETPPDVVRLIVDGFEQLPLSSRTWFVSGRWSVIRTERLAPALRRMLDEVEPGSRSSVFPALIDIAPNLAVEPLSVDILDPKRLISADIVRKMPRSLLSPIAPQLLSVIRKMAGGSPVDTFRLDKKLELLGIIADGTLREDVRQLYDSFPKRYAYGTRESLLRYLLEWDPEAAAPRLKAAVESDEFGTFLYKVSKDGPPLPALSSFLRDRLFDPNPKIVESAAGLLSGERQQDRDAIEQRLLLWRVDRQQRLANGEALKDADGTFESALVRPLVTVKLTPEDRSRMLAACLTDACKAALRER